MLMTVVPSGTWLDSSRPHGVSPFTTIATSPTQPLFMQQSRITTIWKGPCYCCTVKIMPSLIFLYHHQRFNHAVVVLLLHCYCSTLLLCLHAAILSYSQFRCNFATEDSSIGQTRSLPELAIIWFLVIYSPFCCSNVRLDSLKNL